MWYGMYIVWRWHVTSWTLFSAERRPATGLSGPALVTTAACNKFWINSESLTLKREKHQLTTTWSWHIHRLLKKYVTVTSLSAIYRLLPACVFAIWLVIIKSSSGWAIFDMNYEKLAGERNELSQAEFWDLRKQLCLETIRDSRLPCVARSITHRSDRLITISLAQTDL